MTVHLEKQYADWNARAAAKDEVCHEVGIDLSRWQQGFQASGGTVLRYGSVRAVLNPRIVRVYGSCLLAFEVDG
jgi:hypothetical protein